MQFNVHYYSYTCYVRSTHCAKEYEVRLAPNMPCITRYNLNQNITYWGKGASDYTVNVLVEVLTAHIVIWKVVESEGYSLNGLSL